MPKRTYNSTRRREQARQTRRQIAEAAMQLFTERGYAGATIDAIAQAAGVAPESVYSNFGSKRKILWHLLDTSVGGDDERVHLLDRPEPQAVLHEDDPRKQLALFAANITDIVERAAPVFEIMRGAAKTEPEIAELIRTALHQRRRNMMPLARHLAASGPLREGIDSSKAVDTLWTLTSPEVFRLLTVDRGWSKQQYVDWLTDSLIRLLLP
ncbi:MAG: TetR/AcrR family transcriptional regulator [Anaerolineae bacterium]|nr:TetR/AcrR family transcriptional regulator [Anaerolineae bacterium]